MRLSEEKVGMVIMMWIPTLLLLSFKLVVYLPQIMLSAINTAIANIDDGQ